MANAIRSSQVTYYSSPLGPRITTRTSPKISPCGEFSTARLVARFRHRWPKAGRCRLTIVGGDRERSVVTRRGRGRECTPAALDQGLLSGPSTSSLGISDLIDASSLDKGGNVTKKLTRIAPWQAGKLFAVVYFVLSLIFVVPM